MIKQLVVAVSLLMSSSVFAGSFEWMPLGKADDFDQYLNLEKITKVTGSTTKETQVWTKIIMTKDTPEGDRVGDYAMFQQQIRCTDKNIKNLQIVRYYNSGKMLDSADLSDGKYVSVIPDTIQDNLVKLICREVRK